MLALAARRRAGDRGVAVRLRVAGRAREGRRGQGVPRRRQAARRPGGLADPRTTRSPGSRTSAWPPAWRASSARSACSHRLGLACVCAPATPRPGRRAGGSPERGRALQPLARAHRAGRRPREPGAPPRPAGEDRRAARASRSSRSRRRSSVAGLRRLRSRCSRWSRAGRARAARARSGGALASCCRSCCSWRSSCRSSATAAGLDRSARSRFTRPGSRSSPRSAPRRRSAPSSAVLLGATTTLPHVLRGLEALRVPRLFMLIAAFMYRYLFVIVEEARRMRAALAARGYRPRHALQAGASDGWPPRCSCAPTRAASASTWRCSRAATRARCRSSTPLAFGRADVAVRRRCASLVPLASAPGCGMSCAVHATRLCLQLPERAAGARRRRPARRRTASGWRCSARTAPARRR